MVFDRFAAVQALVVGGLFAWAGVWKVFFPAAHALAGQSALAKLAAKLPITPSESRRLARWTHLLVGLGEIAIAAAVLLPPAHPWAMRLATVFALGFLAYLGAAWRFAPEKPCGCMGGRVTKISRRSVARAGVLLALTLAGWPAQVYWGAALLSTPWTVVVVAAEGVLLWALSPEFNTAGAHFNAGVQFERRFVRAARLRLDPTCARVALDWNGLERHLARSAAFIQVVRLAQLGGAVDRWREGCTGYIAYDAVYKDGAATAIFAMPLLYDAREVTAAVVDATQDTIFFQVAPAPTTQDMEPQSEAPAQAH